MVCAIKLFTLSDALRHIKVLKNKIINSEKRQKFKDKIAEIEKNIYREIKYKKIIIEQLKSLSHSKRHMVKQTWDKYIKDCIALII